MKGRAFAAVVLSALLLLSGLGIGGWWLLWQRGPLELAHHRLTMPRAARFVPASAFFSLYLFSDGQRPVDYARAVAPARQRRPAGEAIARLRDGAFAAAGLDYQDELAAWLGGDIAMALVEDPVAAAAAGASEQPARGWLLALASRDDDGARRFLQRFWQTRSLAGTDLQVSRYRGMGLISGRGTLLGGQPQPLATALVDDDLVLIASGRNLLERALDVSQVPELNQAGQPLLRQGVASFASGAALVVASPDALETWLGWPAPVAADGPARPVALSQAAAAARGLPRTAALAAALPDPVATEAAGSEPLGDSSLPSLDRAAVPSPDRQEQGGQAAEASTERQTPQAEAADAPVPEDSPQEGSAEPQASASPPDPALLPQDAAQPPEAASQAPPPPRPAQASTPEPAPDASPESAAVVPPAPAGTGSAGSTPSQPIPATPVSEPPAHPRSLPDRAPVASPAVPLSSAKQQAVPAPASGSATPSLLAVLQPQGRQLELRARLLSPQAPRLLAAQPEWTEALLAALRGSPTSVVLIQDPAGLAQEPWVRPLLERSLGLRPQVVAERQGPLPALLARSIQGPLLASLSQEGWQLGSKAGDPAAADLQPLLGEVGLLEAPLSQDGRHLTVWTHLSLPGRAGRRDRAEGDALVAPLAGWSEQRQDLTWWGQTLVALDAPAESRSLTTLRRSLRDLGAPQAPLQWGLDAEGARTLLRSWQPWRLLSALAGGGLDGSVRGLALALESPSDASALELRARLNLGT